MLNTTKVRFLLLALVLGLAPRAGAQQQVQGTGTAGTPAGNVLSIQGVASGTVVPISGTITANLGTLNGLFLDATFTGRMPAGASPANAETNTNAALSRIGSYNFIFNGTTWDRWTGAVTNGGTFAVQAAQSGTWNITNVSGTVSLPTLASTSTKQSDGSQKTQIVDGSGNVIASTSNNLNVQCANCTGSGVSATDAATFTATTSLFAPGGGFFQTTATSNPLTTGQQGTFQVTANRALFTNLRNAAGTEVGTSTTPLQVTLANTGSNATAVKVDGSAVTQPISAAALPLPSGASTSALQTTGNTSLGSIDTKTPALGQALAAASVPVILPSATITTLTPPAAITGFATSTKQSDGTAKTQIVDGSGNVIASTSNNLNVQCANCSGSGASAVDNATVTESTSVFAPIGAEFQTTPGTVTTGHQAMLAMTAKRALQVSLFDTSGTAVTPSIDATTNTTTQTTGPQLFANGSTATPTAAGADGRSIALWSTLSGSLHTTCDSGCSGGTTDADDGTIAGGQTTGLNLGLTQVYDGSNWKRLTIGTAGTASAQVVTVQGVASMTPLLVTPAANSAVNVAQINGVTTTMGNGASGTGVQRVTIASDSTGTIVATSATAANLLTRTDTSGATGAAPPARADYIGGLGAGATGGFVAGIPVADGFQTVSITTATTTLLITGVSGRHVRISAIHLLTGIANNVALISGTGATCGTGTTGMAGGTTAANGYNFAANGGLTLGSGVGSVMRTTATGDSVCAVTSANGPLAGTIAYTIY